jgi:hypothetical protein
MRHSYAIHDKYSKYSNPIQISHLLYMRQIIQIVYDKYITVEINKQTNKQIVYFLLMKNVTWDFK